MVFSIWRSGWCRWSAWRCYFEPHVTPARRGMAGVDFELKGLVTKSFNRWSLHFNPAYEFLSGGGHDERDGRYRFTLGTSYPIGAPKYTRTTLVGGLFTEQSSREGEANVGGAEAGFRHQMTQRLVLDFGVGSEFAGPAKRSSFFVTTGISFAF